MPKLEKYTNGSVNHQCPTCDGFDSHVVYKYTYGASESFVYKCHTCSLEFLRPIVFTGDQRKMDTTDEEGLLKKKFLRNLYKQFIVRPEISRVTKLLGNNNLEMLDIGCGTGLISEMWSEAGIKVTGLEPSQIRGEYARKRGIRVIPCYVEDLDSEECFDLIIIRHVLEHLENPKDILCNIKKHLKPNGILLVIVPNLDCIGRKLFDAEWAWLAPMHCNYYNPPALKRTLINADYDIFDFYQTPTPFWYGSCFKQRFPIIGKVLQKTRLLSLATMPIIFCGYLLNHSDNLTVFARSKS